MNIRIKKKQSYAGNVGRMRVAGTIFLVIETSKSTL